MKRHFPTLPVLLSLIVAVAAAAVLPEWGRWTPTLLRVSTKSVSLGPWHPNVDNYFWVSPQALLVLHDDLSAPGGVNVQAWQVQVPNGRRSEMSGVEAAYNGAGTQTSSVARWLVSPDGRWLLGLRTAGKPSPAWVAASLDGRRVVRRTCTETDDTYSDGLTLRPQTPSADTNAVTLHTAWSPDSRSWVSLAPWGNGARLDRFSLSDPRASWSALDFMPQQRIVLGYVSPGRVLCAYNHTGDGGGVGVVNFPTTGTAPVAIYYVHLPANMDVREVVLSPDGQRLAWKLAVKPLPFGLTATSDSTFVRRERPDRVGLWTSRLDCSGLQEIGTVDAANDTLCDVRWTPDGHHLSFVDGGTLYIAPAG